jgi:hypothetical protein
MNTIRKIVITSEDKCLYEKRYLLGTVLLLIIFYNILYYLYNSIELSIISTAILFMTSILISKSIGFKPYNSRISKYTNTFIIIIILIISLQKSLYFIYDDSLCKDKGNCLCERKYKKRCVIAVWALIFLLLILHKLKLIELIIKLPGKIKNRGFQFIAIIVLMVIGSIVFSVGEVAPVIIIFAAQYWDFIKISDNSLIQFIISFLIFSILSIILCIFVGIIFFKIGGMIDNEIIKILFTCFNYSKEYEIISNAIVDKSKKHQLFTLTLILRLSPLLPYQWVSLLFGTVCCDKDNKYTMSQLYQYIIGSSVGIYVTIIPYILIGYIAHRTIKSECNVSHYFDNTYNNNYITNAIEIIGSKFFPKNTNEFIEFFVNIFIGGMFIASSKLISEYSKKNMGIDL